MSALERLWVCLVCGTKNQFQHMLAADTMRCPTCRSDAMEPADGRTITVENSEWQVPPITN